jgi:dihydropteroate synthase
MTTLQLPDRVLTLDPARPLLMGIVNANPDSFSDVTRLRTLDAQVRRALELVADGAQIIDVGGESGVTYTEVTAAEQEIARVVPLVRALVAEGVIVSVDTWKAPVAAAALDAGAAIVNDVSGLRDPALAQLAAEHRAGLVVMHTRAAPKREHFHDYAGDVRGDVRAFIADRCALARAQGVSEEQLILDPGPDFAKTPAETVAVLRDVAALATAGRPLLLALSRKYFVGAITGRVPGERLAGTLGAVAWAARLGVASILRLHDVREAADLLAVLRVLEGRAAVPDFDAADDALKWIAAPAPSDS